MFFSISTKGIHPSVYDTLSGTNCIGKIKICNMKNLQDISKHTFHDGDNGTTTATAITILWLCVSPGVKHATRYLRSVNQAQTILRNLEIVQKEPRKPHHQQWKWSPVLRDPGLHALGRLVSTPSAVTVLTWCNHIITWIMPPTRKMQQWHQQHMTALLKNRCAK